MKIKNKRAILRLSVALLAIFIFSALCACSVEEKESKSVSIGMEVLSNRDFMAKSALRGESIKFSVEDFARAVNLERVESVTITSVPPTTDGTLCVGSTVLNGAQTLSASSVGLMTYNASSAVSSSEFRFRVNDLPYEMTCKLYMLDSKNYAPTLSVAPKTATEVCVYENVTYFGTLPCYDADGDETFIEVVSYPEKGLLIFDDRSLGAYRYIPDADSTGRDSFVCVARDIYGNYSPSVEVSLEVKRTESSTRFVDLAESPYHNAALAMNERGVMSGTRVGSLLYFYPDREISRSEFVMMAMNAAGITEVNPAEATVFADDSDIPTNMKGFISAAYDLGYIKGTTLDGELRFEGQRAITRAEAAVMLSNMLNGATPTFKPTFSDADDVPTWAQASLSEMCAMGVMFEGENGIEANAALTRGAAAVILANFASVK